jgi:hypothetical protein
MKIEFIVNKKSYHNFKEDSKEKQSVVKINNKILSRKPIGKEDQGYRYD